MWLRAKNLFDSVQCFVGARDEENEAVSDRLLNNLTRNRSLLINIYRNTGKNAAHRTQVSKIGEVIKLDSGQVGKIDEELRCETLIMSDLFNCDELDALDLVLIGEVQVQHFPCLTRGLCAVVCYYDAHRFLSSTLKTLLECKLNEDCVKSKELSEFLNRFFSDEMLATRLIEILQSTSVQTELQNLHQPHINGLGGPKHQQILHELIEETLKNCGEILHLLCASWRLDVAPPFLDHLFNPLKKLPPTTTFENSHLSLWISLLIFISPHNLQNMRCARNLLLTFHKELIMEEWTDACLQASLQFALVVSYNWLNVHQLVHEVLGDFALKENELLEKSLDGLALQFIRKCVIDLPKFHEDEVVFTMVDSLFKNFIANFSSQIMILQRAGEMELQSVEENLARGHFQQLKLHYENLLRSVADIYQGRTPQMITLSNQYTSDSDELIKFLKNGKGLVSPVMQVAYLDMLKSLCKSEESGHFLFNLLMFESSKYAYSALNWNHFWKALRLYLDLFLHRTNAAGSFQKPEAQSEIAQHITQTELAGLIAWVQLAESVALNDISARRQFIDNPAWMCIGTSVGLVSSSVPLVLKGSLFRFLASLAIEDCGAAKIWSALLAHSVIAKSSTGKLVGIQEELETRECAVKCYDSSLGFLHLLKALFLHPLVIDTSQSLLYLQFIMKTIICQFANRSYENVQQMWHLCALACDSISNLLNNYAVTAESILSAHPQVIILTQILNDAPVFRSLGAVLHECMERLRNYSPRFEARESAALSVLRLIDSCVLLRTPLADAIRATDSSIIISSLDSLFLNVVPGHRETTYFSVIASYLTQAELLPRHALRATSIIRELCSGKPFLQPRFVESVYALTDDLIECCSRLTSVHTTSMKATPFDPVSFKETECTDVECVRGETACELLEICINSIESDPCSANLAYLLCGFNVKELSKSIIESPGVNGTPKTFFHSAIEAVIELITNEDFFSLPFSALYEPCLRFLLRLVTPEASCSSLVLRFLRTNHDLIYRLLECATLLDPDHSMDNEENMVFKNLKRMINGLILQLSAIELASLLKMKNCSQSKRYFRLMFSQGGSLTSTSDCVTQDDSCDVQYTPNSQKNEKDWPMIWKLLNAAKLSYDQIEVPVLEIISAKKLQPILTLCIRSSATNVQQCDVEHLNWLLKRESLSVASELQTNFMDSISNDIQQILKYCAACNLARHAEASSRQLVIGWLSFINVLTVFSPVPFLSLEDQFQYLSDALYLLISFTFPSELDTRLSIFSSHALLRLTIANCSLLLELKSDAESSKSAINDILISIIKYAVRPGKRPLQTKLDIYACISYILNCSTESSESTSDSTKSDNQFFDKFLCDINVSKVESANVNRSNFLKYGVQLVSMLATDICDSPTRLRLVALSCLAQILREDALHNQMLSMEFVRSGALRYVLDSISASELSGADATDSNTLSHFNSTIVLFIRLALTECGWSGLNDVNALKVLESMPIWSSPPNEIFRSELCDISPKSVSGQYLEAIENIVHLCVAVCSNPHWKRLSSEVLSLIGRNSEVLNQLMRAGGYGTILEPCALLVSHMHSLDQSTHSLIAKSNCLSALKDLPVKLPSSSSDQSAAPSFNTPLNLFESSVNS